MGCYQAVFSTAIGLSGTGVLIFYSNLDSEWIGFGIMFLLNFSTYLSFVIRMMLMLSLQMTSVERMLRYTTLRKEADMKTAIDEKLGSEWPNEGRIEFKNVEFRYREELKNTLKGVKLKLEGGQKIGCVGRTGAGKSSMIQAIFRMCELHKGTIEIDGQDCS
jgi:ABC-type multidrug transport system fused ATPase/permease subunit